MQMGASKDKMFKKPCRFGLHIYSVVATRSGCAKYRRKFGKLYSSVIKDCAENVVPKVFRLTIFVAIAMIWTTYNCFA